MKITNNSKYREYTLRKYDYFGFNNPELEKKEIWNFSFRGRSLGSIERVSKFGYVINWVHKGKSWPKGLKRRSLQKAFDAACSVYDEKLDAIGGPYPIVNNCAQIRFINGGDWR